MNTIFKNTVRGLLSVLVFGVLFSCSDSTSDSTPVEPQEPREIQLGFDGLVLVPEEGGMMSKVGVKSIDHNYITDGYIIEITGAVAPGDAYHTDMDLTQGLTVEVSGDIQITVKHPNFYSNNVLTEAFYGIEDYPVPTGSSDVNIVPLELVQGFVMVTSDELIEPVITEVRILGLEKELNTIYYTDAANVDVIVRTDGYGNLQGNHATELGEGVQYNVTYLGDGIEFTFPEFGDPGDGIWNP